MKFILSSSYKTNTEYLLIKAAKHKTLKHIIRLWLNNEKNKANCHKLKQYQFNTRKKKSILQRINRLTMAQKKNNTNKEKKNDGWWFKMLNLIMI